MTPNMQGPLPGDVLVYWGTYTPQGTQEPIKVPSHVALVGEGGMIVHNTINPINRFAGVVQHKGSSASQGYLNLDGTQIDVYRCTGMPHVAKSAVKFATSWADPTAINKGADFATAGGNKLNSDRARHWSHPHDDYIDLNAQMNPWLGVKPQQMSQFRGGKSPYSSGRLSAGQTSDRVAWDVKSAFRAVKAYVRTCTDMGLSPRHGTSCDQFVMYCYQAASLECLLGPNAKLDPAIIDLVSRNAKQIKLYVQEGDLTKDLGEDLACLKGQPFDDLRAILKTMTGDTCSMGYLPQAMTSDAKTSSVQKLFDVISTEQSGFEPVGQLNKAFLVDPGKKPGTLAPETRSKHVVTPQKGPTTSTRPADTGGGSANAALDQKATTD